jgi:hypothetical protein
MGLEVPGERILVAYVFFELGGDSFDVDMPRYPQSCMQEFLGLFNMGLEFFVGWMENRGRDNSAHTGNLAVPRHKICCRETLPRSQDLEQ